MGFAPCLGLIVRCAFLRCLTSPQRVSDVALSSLVANPSEHLPKDPSIPTFVVCRLGNDSQIAADALRSVAQEGMVVKDVVGGLRAWSKQIDDRFPIY